MVRSDPQTTLNLGQPFDSLQTPDIPKPPPAVVIKQVDYDITSTAGLAYADIFFWLIASLLAKIDRALPVRKDAISTSDIIKCYLALLLMGKTDYEAIENYRNDEFFKTVLRIKQVPSSSTIRQRLDEVSQDLFEFLTPLNELLLSRLKPDFNLPDSAPQSLSTSQNKPEYLFVDGDTTVFDNSGSKKEGVECTYTKVEGYCPLIFYIASYCLDAILRPGSMHSASETPDAIERIGPMAQRLSAANGNKPIVFRLDSGFDSAQVMAAINGLNVLDLPSVDWIIKWNPRKALDKMIESGLADPTKQWNIVRFGKRETIWEELVMIEGIQRPLRRILRLSESIADPQGQLYLKTKYTLDGWTTSLGQDFDAREIIQCYKEHATHEQYHAELKSELNLERLPSGKFDTNYVVCQLAVLAMNMLRYMGQQVLLEPDAPIRHCAERRRIKTVLQELIYKAARIIRHGRTIVLGLGANDPSAKVFMRMYEKLYAIP